MNALQVIGLSLAVLAGSSWVFLSRGSGERAERTGTKAILAAAIVSAILAVVFLLARERSPAGFDNASQSALNETQEALRVTDETQKEIAALKEKAKRLAGDIRDKKEAEIRALPPDTLVDRHLSALARFCGVSDDREGTGRMDSP